MWKPPQRIKYRPHVESNPTEQQAANALWFNSIDIGPIQLAQRTWVPAMVPWRASEEGFVTDDVIDWYARFAQGCPGAIVIEATGVRDVPSGPLLRIGHDRFIPGLKKLVNAVQDASAGQTRLFIQLIDFLSIRRRPDPEKYFQHYLTITDRHREQLNAVGCNDKDIRRQLSLMDKEQLQRVLTEVELEALLYGYRERVTDMHLATIRELPRKLPGLFATAAVRAQQAGFDGVELHYAHAYTLASFLSAKNNRDDGYGGTRENRLRLPLEVLQAVQTQVNDNFIVGCRYLSDECIEQGSDLNDAVYFGTEFARAGMDFVSVSRGGKFEDAAQPKVGWTAYPYTGPSGYECMPGYLSDEQGPFGRNIEPTAEIRRAIRAAGFKTPVVVCGGIHSFQQAESLLKEGKADIVAAARQTLADPDWFVKTRDGHGACVRLCEYTNYCEGLDQKHKQVTCKLWDRVQLDEPGVKLSRDGKRRLIAPDKQIDEP